MEVLGYVKHKDTGEVRAYTQKEENGYEVYVERVGVPTKDWWAASSCKEVDGPETYGYPENDFEMAISNLCDELKETLIKKNRDYGDSVRKTYKEFGDIAYIVRITDKIERLKSLEHRDNEVSESKEDTWKDLAGYSILRNATVKVGE